ncbi:MAG: methylglyoxal synthase [Oscillospiraceae bacterium]|jgi:methylglyoxal synthase|nr:methylglyoxal synthase [Oscillospiraceae bacterium]
MNIVLIAQERKRDLLIRFCDAYRVILQKHSLFTTEELARAIGEAMECNVDAFLTKQRGGYQQIASRVICNEVDLFIFFRDPLTTTDTEEMCGSEVLRMCDVHSVPFATNIATAETIILGLERGDLDWRIIMNSSSLERLERTGASDVGAT